MHGCCFLSTSKLAATSRNNECFAVSQASEQETAGVIIHIHTFKYILLCFSYGSRNKSNKYKMFKCEIIIYITAEHIVNQPSGVLLRVG